MPRQKKNETLTDLEPKQDPKGGIIAVLIGLLTPAEQKVTPVTPLPTVSPKLGR